ncbi:MAG TPA: polysaccharide pyruvyl transferase family protein [Segetibacter sp.]|jgi:hypothetical protein
MNVLKIGVLTFHRCINYGSYWQSRCLVEGLQAKGHNAEILDHQSRRVNYLEWKCAMQPVLPTAVPKADHPLYRKKIESFFKLFETLPLSPRFALDASEEMNEYDVVVVGSDEVWNLFHPWYSNCPLFYGDGIKAKSLISYAASFGNYPYTWGLGEEWANRLRNFEFISVRDENSQLIVKNALGIEPQMVLDPCLQFSVEPDERNSHHWEKPYLAVYGHNFSEFYINQVKQVAKEQNLPLISIGYRNDWADEQWIDADPHEFAHFIARSEGVVTNFFHGCVFALRNNKPFVCETSPYRDNKLRGLMAKISGEKHLVMEDTPSAIYQFCLTNPLDEKIREKIELLRHSSHEFLNLALAVKQLHFA